MGPLDLLIHLTSFAAPALAVAVLLAVMSPLVLPKAPGARTFIGYAAINFVAALAVLLLGLWLFGRDGKMATYAAMVAVGATAQWLAARAWRG